MQQCPAGAHERLGIDPGVRDAAREHADHGRHFRIQGLADTADLIEREDGGDVQLHALFAKLLDQRQSRFRARVGDRNLHVHVPAPGCDLERLTLHLGKFVGEDLEGNRLGGDALENLLRERLVVADAGLAHQRRVGRHALDERIGVEAEDAGLVGAVGKEFDAELLKQSLHKHWQVSGVFGRHQATGGR